MRSCLLVTFGLVALLFVSGCMALPHRENTLAELEEAIAHIMEGKSEEEFMSSTSPMASETSTTQHEIFTRDEDSLGSSRTRRIDIKEKWTDFKKWKHEHEEMLQHAMATILVYDTHYKFSFWIIVSLIPILLILNYIRR
eukprot:Nk52_evm12s158 gene=Nk52_evmTU12s158